MWSITKKASKSSKKTSKSSNKNKKSSKKKCNTHQDNEGIISECVFGEVISESEHSEYNEQNICVFGDLLSDSEITESEITESELDCDIDNCEKILKETFGYDHFRGYQYKIIKNIIEDKKDVCAIMFTGAGKSICYQFPAIFSKKTAVVISPLIALMNDQQIKLGEINIPSVCLNSTVANKIDIKKEILKNSYRLVYTTPEYFVKNTNFFS